MSWLGGRLPKWGPFGGGSTAILEREETPEPEVVADNDSPQLMVLVNDASGFACFKTHTFPNAQAATEFILFWFRNDTDGFSAFWAMTREPQSHTPSGTIAEPLVMIKDAQRVDVVYSFSFVDRESAEAFVHDEVENGTDFGQITVYWAVPVRLVTDALGRSMLTPSVPPRVVAAEETEADTADMWAAQEERAVEPVAEPDPAAEPRRVFKEAPNAHTGVANGMSVGQETFELTSWIERARKKPQRKGTDKMPSGRSSSKSALETRELPADAPSEPLAVAVADEAPVADRGESIDGVARPPETAEDPALLSQSPAAPNGFEDLSEEPSMKLAEVQITEDTLVENAVLEDAVVETVVEEAVVEAAVVESVDAPPSPEIEDRAERDEQQDERIEASVGDSEPDVKPESRPVQTEADRRLGESNEQYDGSHNGFITLEPVDIVVHTNGHSKIKPAEPPAEVTESPEATIETEAEQITDSEKDEAFDIRIDIQLGSSRAMKVKRWGIHENPFNGFKSPRGRF